MRHDWKPHPENGTIKAHFLERRVCANCGAEQEWESDGQWLRIGRWSWQPPVGRCKGKKQ